MTASAVQTADTAALAERAKCKRQRQRPVRQPHGALATGDRTASVQLLAGRQETAGLRESPQVNRQFTSDRPAVSAEERSSSRADRSVRNTRAQEPDGLSVRGEPGRPNNGAVVASGRVKREFQSRQVRIRLPGRSGSEPYPGARIGSAHPVSSSLSLRSFDVSSSSSESCDVSSSQSGLCQRAILEPTP